MLFDCHPTILHKHCFQFLLGVTCNWSANMWYLMGMCISRKCPFNRHREFCCNSDWLTFDARLLRCVEIKDKCKKVAFKLKSDLNWCQSWSHMLKASNQSQPQNLDKICLGNRPTAYLCKPELLPSMIGNLNRGGRHSDSWLQKRATKKC